MEYDPVEITRLLVFGSSSPSSDDYSEHIRPATAGNPGIDYSMQSYMTTGAGRYAFPSLFQAIKLFFESSTSLEDGSYNWAAMSNNLGLSPAATEAATKLHISNYATDPGSEDFALRCYIFGNSDFYLNTSTLKFVVTNGVRTLENLEVLAEVDNFDYYSEGRLIALFNNIILSPAFDPYSLSGGQERRVKIYFGGDGRKFTQFGLGDYDEGLRAGAVVSTYTAPVSAGAGLLFNAYAFGELFNTISEDEYLGYLSGDRSVIYGSADDDVLTSSSFVRSFNNPLVQDTLLLVGGGMTQLLEVITPTSY